ncbi:MAG: dihydrofolate reductase family protein [Thermoleophilaceae bacterium]|nr:dihydrofolate reductase family protein [Thermoleophilaceae bacterium]
MAKLIYSTLTSLDGFIEDADGNFDFSMPSAEVHQYINDQLRPVGTHIYGRRLYETMAVWETMDTDGTPPEGLSEEHAEVFRELQPQSADFKQIWLGADKIVYSTTLEDVWTARTELRSEFDPQALRAFKDSASADIVIGGAELASAAFAAGLVDEVSLTLFPVTVGAGKPGFPTDQQLQLDLVDERRFENGSVHLKYRVR